MCACGCGKSARAGEYNSNCKVPCKCGCGGRARYAYMPGHAPKQIKCKRCGRAFSPKGRYVNCSQCRRHLRAGRPATQNTDLISARQRQAKSPTGKRWCAGCSRYRALKFFGQYNDAGKRKHYARCKPCLKAQGRASSLVKKYNITINQYEEIKASQGGRCAICQRATGAQKALAVDHDHSCCGPGGSCGKCIRGLLCSMCNKSVLGHLRDDVEALRRAIKYLEDPPAQAVISKVIAPIELPNLTSNGGP